MYMYWALQAQIHTLQLCTADWFFLVYKSHTLKALLTLVFTNTRWSFFGRISFSFTTAKLHQFHQKTKKYSNYQVFIKFVFDETYINMYTYCNQFFNCISIQLSKNQMSIYLVKFILWQTIWRNIQVKIHTFNFSFVLKGVKLRSIKHMESQFLLPNPSIYHNNLRKER